MTPAGTWLLIAGVLGLGALVCTVLAEHRRRRDEALWGPDGDAPIPYTLVYPPVRMPGFASAEVDRDWVAGTIARSTAGAGSVIRVIAGGQLDGLTAARNRDLLLRPSVVRR